MHNIQHIVAATDFSESAGFAVKRAACLAKRLDAELHLIHVVHPLDLYAGSELSYDFQMHYQQIQQETIKTELQALAVQLREQYNVSVHECSRIGRAFYEIADYARHVHAGLVVVGAQGENSLLAKLLGSTALRLIKVAHCPVLIVKNRHHEPDPYQQVVAAVDFTAGSTNVPSLAKAIAPDAKIEALLVFDSNQEAHMHKAGMDESLLADYRKQALQQAQQKLDRIVSEQDSGRFSSHIISGYPPEVICARIKSVGADLVVIGRQNRNQVEEWLLGSVTKGVAYAAESDVLLSR